MNAIFYNIRSIYKLDRRQVNFLMFKSADFICLSETRLTRKTLQEELVSLGTTVFGRIVDRKLVKHRMVQPGMH